jgi:hypothetical protein
VTELPHSSSMRAQRLTLAGYWLDCPYRLVSNASTALEILN